MTGTTSYGIYINNSNHIVVAGQHGDARRSAGQRTDAAGIELVRGRRTSTVTGNTSDHNSDHGIYLQRGRRARNVISDNEASCNAEGYRRNANGIDVTGPTNTIIGNVVHDNEDSGLQFYTGGNNNLATLERRRTTTATTASTT